MQPLVIIGLLAGKALASAILYRSLSDPLSSKITEYVLNVPASMIYVTDEPGYLADVLHREYPLPEVPHQISLPNNGKTIVLPGGVGKFEVFAFTPEQGGAVVVAAGYDRKRRFRMLPILVQGGNDEDRQAMKHRIEKLCREKSRLGKL